MRIGDKTNPTQIYTRDTIERKTRDLDTTVTTSWQRAQGAVVDEITLERRKSTTAVGQDATRHEEY